MAIYQLIFSDAQGVEAAQGVIHCADDAQAKASAERLLHGKDKWRAVAVANLGRPVGTIRREELIDV